MNKISPAPSSIQNGKHSFPVRVYYEDTDAGQVVFYANYLKFAERARTELLRSLGIEQDALRETDEIGFVVRKCDADYQKPARLDDLLEVQTEILKLGFASITMCQTVLRDNEVLVVMNVKLACVDFGGGGSTRLPENIRTMMADLINSKNEEK